MTLNNHLQVTMRDWGRIIIIILEPLLTNLLKPCTIQASAEATRRTGNYQKVLNQSEREDEDLHEVSDPVLDKNRRTEYV